MTCKWEKIAQTHIDRHKAKGPCLFAPGAAARIGAAGRHAEVQGAGRVHEIMDALIEAIEEEEIYCPHEGVDRRAEFGILAEET